MDGSVDGCALDQLFFLLFRLYLFLKPTSSLDHNGQPIVDSDQGREFGSVFQRIVPHTYFGMICLVQEFAHDHPINTGYGRFQILGDYQSVGRIPSCCQDKLYQGIFHLFSSCFLAKALRFDDGEVESLLQRSVDVFTPLEDLWIIIDSIRRLGPRSKSLRKLYQCYAAVHLFANDGTFQKHQDEFHLFCIAFYASWDAYDIVGNTSAFEKSEMRDGISNPLCMPRSVLQEFSKRIDRHRIRRGYHSTSRVRVGEQEQSMDGHSFRTTLLDVRSIPCLSPHLIDLTSNSVRSS